MFKFIIRWTMRSIVILFVGFVALVFYIPDDYKSTAKEVKVEKTVAKKEPVAATVAITTSAQAEIKYNYKNEAHIADMKCIAALSMARDALFSEVEVSNGMVWLKTVEPTADVVKARNTLGDIQDQYILKYAYSKQLNKHVEVRKMYFKNVGGFEENLNRCL